MEIYYIGGSPCSGKSTVAELLAKKYEFGYYRLDDRLFDFMRMAAEQAKPRSGNYFALTPDGIWLRTPEAQFEDEVKLYREMFEYVRSDMERLSMAHPIIAEGAGFMPELMEQIGVDSKHYFSIVPTSAFQLEHYKKRPFVSDVLQGCSDKQSAFDRWMKRDILFADYADQTAKKLGYQSLRIDGTLTPESVLRIVEGQFMLG